ncbi:hypothetical protein D3875_03805 [Deinococcus cavernae]|uniref:Uncharacterized protein n=1 Tax=Deinococcus cavernae TaxID=2320857 RepID=A0A418VEC5_9DEIO|nr:hypothetical protein [Deinococcus cavernae]RJF74413.1 hypothetical protein D3875_03805 [Deinococcus cavernae]
MTAPDLSPASVVTVQATPLMMGTRVRVTGPNIWGQPEDQGRTAVVTLVDVMGDVGVQFIDGCAPFGNWYPLSSLEVRA